MTGFRESTDIRQNRKRAELHLHTVYSRKSALTRVEDAFAKAAELGCCAVAVTDCGSVQAFPEALRAAQKYGVRMICGLVCDCVKDGAQEAVRVVLLAKNEAGRKNLYKLIAYGDGSSLCISEGVLCAHREGLLVGSAGYGGEVARAALDERDPLAQAAEAAAFYDYIEICPTREKARVSGCVLDRSEQRRLNLCMAEAARAAGKLPVAVGEVQTLEEDDEAARKVLLYAAGSEEWKEEQPLYFRTTEEMLREFSYLGEEQAKNAVIGNPLRIAEAIETDTVLFAKEPFSFMPEGTQEELERKCRERARRLYGEPLPEPVQKRLTWELKALKENAAWEMFAAAERAAAQAEDVVSTGGGLASLLTAFLLGISQVNPLPPHYVCPSCGYSTFAVEERYVNGYDLPRADCPQCGERLSGMGFDLCAETAIGLRGERKPDMILYLPEDGKAAALEQLKTLSDNVQPIRAGFACTVSLRLAWEYVCSYLQENDISMSLEEQEETVEKLMGAKRDDGCLPGAFYLVPAQAAELLPVHWDGTERIAHFPAWGIDTWLSRIDLHGHTLPGVVRELARETGVPVSDVPFDDAEVLEFIAADGLSEFADGRRIQDVVGRVRPADFANLLKIFGLAFGTGTWEAHTQDMLKDAELKNMIALRDDVMHLLMKKGMARERAYDYMERMRKGGLGWGKEAECRKAELRAHGVEERHIDSLLRIRHLFSKADVAERSVRLYRTAWYKLHYPHSYAAVMARHGNVYPE